MYVNLLLCYIQKKVENAHAHIVRRARISDGLFMLAQEGLCVLGRP